MNGAAGGPVALRARQEQMKDNPMEIDAKKKAFAYYEFRISGSFFTYLVILKFSFRIRMLDTHL